MKINDYKKIKDRRYSPKEVLAHFVLCGKESFDKSFESIVVEIEDTFINNINNKKILEILDNTLLKKIENYWSLSMEQAIAYGIIVFYNLKFENREINEEEITDMFVYVMKIYSPDNALELVKRKTDEF